MLKYKTPLQDPCTFQWNNPRLMTPEECRESERVTGMPSPVTGPERDWVIAQAIRAYREGKPRDTTELTLEYRRLKAEGKL